MQYEIYSKQHATAILFVEFCRNNLQFVVSLYTLHFQFTNILFCACGDFLMIKKIEVFEQCVCTKFYSRLNKMFTDTLSLQGAYGKYCYEVYRILRLASAVQMRQNVHCSHLQFLIMLMLKKCL